MTGEVIQESDEEIEVTVIYCEEFEAGERLD